MDFSRAELLRTIYLSHTRGLDSLSSGPSIEEQGCRGGGATGTEGSRAVALRCSASCGSAGGSLSAAQEPALLAGPAGGSSGPTAPCRPSSAAACSASRVGDAGGDRRALRLADAPESSFSKPFFSFCKPKAVPRFRTKLSRKELNTSF